jgi:oligopeptide/dipeptide ABC transporter ATP-binding protein
LNLSLAEQPMLSVQNVTKHYPVASNLPWLPPTSYVRAVDGLSFEVLPRKTFSIVGESGCGKTTTAKLVLNLELPTTGRVLFQNRNTAELNREEQAHYRRTVQAVFQNPFSSLNPRMRVLDLISEPRVIQGQVNRKEVKEEVERQLDSVGLDRAIINSFPHELSGGMRQRVAIARALILQPLLIVLDEPVSALDVSVRAQIMNLFKSIQETLGISYLLIAHDLATTRYLSHQILVMYLGQMVETSDSNELFSHPLHPYTQALISASAPSRRWENPDDNILQGDPPSPIAPPPGCRFHTRCPRAFDRCRADIPEIREVSPGHHVACHLY